MINKDFFEGPVGDYCIARNTIKCLFTKRTLVTLTFNLVNPGHVLAKTSHQVIIESTVINRPQDNEQKALLIFITLVTLTFDLVNPKSIWFVSSPRPISM